MDGTLDIWDYIFKQNDPILSLQVRVCARVCEYVRACHRECVRVIVCVFLCIRVCQVYPRVCLMYHGVCLVYARCDAYMYHRQDATGTVEQWNDNIW